MNKFLVVLLHKHYSLIKKKSHINGGILIVHHLVKRAHIESKFNTLGTLQGQHTDP